ncbi:MAG TPA: ABC transporter ATP-binding protein [Jiangellaceae bacterium]
MTAEASPGGMARPQDDDPGRLRTLRTLLGYARPHRGVLAVGLLLTLLASATALAQPLVAEAVVSALGNDEPVTRWVVILTAMVVVSALLGGFAGWLMSRTGERIVLDVRRRLVHRLIRLRVGALDQHPPGDLTARVTSDSSLLNTAASMSIVQLTDGLLSIVAGVVIMGVMEIRLLAVTLAVLALVAVLMMVVLPRIRKAIEAAQESVGGIAAALDRALGAARTVKANGGEGRETEVATAAAEQAYDAGLRAAKYNAGVGVIADLAIQVSFLAVLGLGGILVAAGSLEVATLVGFLLLLFYLTGPIFSLLGGVSELQQGLGALRRIEEVEAMPAEDDVDDVDGESGRGESGRADAAPPTARAVTTEPARRAPTLELRAVSFAYPGRGGALDEVSFTAPPGAQTALVGLSGAGKTTIFSLIQRFYDPDGGAILLDGIDTSTWSRARLRRRIAYVEQDAPVLAGTIGENLRYGAPHASPADAEAALAEAGLSAMIDRLPDGLDTPVGTRGVTLSGGERQRLAIARALVRRPDVLLLDEATAALDARNESALRETVARAAAQCTVLLIAHRLSTVTACEQIVVLEHGRVRGVGSHEELLVTDDLYRELAATQLLAAQATE